jgi:serine/threonine-protein kinase
VIHRDIKPGNILLSGRNALVTDFGIARAIEAAGGGVRETAPGLAIGTPAYMAPEQVAGDRNADHRVDIYAAGLVMYEMLQGGLPFSGESTRQLILARLTQDPLPVTRADCPSELAELVARCLARAPDDRPPTAEALLAAGVTDCSGHVGFRSRR